MTAKHMCNRRHRYPQRGAALIVSMVMLVVMTLIGVVAMSGSHLEWLMTNNSQFQSGAYRNATVALRAGLDDTSIPPSGVDAPAPPSQGSVSPAGSTLSPSDLSDADKWNDGTLNYNAVTTPQCTANCRYIVEFVGCSVFTPTSPTSAAPSANACNVDPNDISIHSYRVWAYGSDGKGASRILQVTMRRIHNPAGTTPQNMKVVPLPPNWAEIR